MGGRSHLSVETSGPTMLIPLRGRTGAATAPGPGRPQPSSGLTHRLHCGSGA